MRWKIFAYVAVTSCLCVTTAFAHSLNLFVHDDGASIKGNAYFTGGTPAQNVTVRVEDAANTLLGETKTDSEGNFVYSGPRATGTTLIVAVTQDGHRAQASVESASGTTAPAAAGPAPASQSGAEMKSFEAHMAELHEAINRLENRLWLRDVLGGIGYIFGLAGLWALIKARSGRNGR